MAESYRLLRFVAGLRAKFGHAPSMVVLGALAEDDPREDAIAVANHWYEQAAERGSSQAMWNLGVNHLGSKGGTADFEQAVYWLERAGEQNHPLALWALGKMYLAGRVVEKNVARGLELLRRAGEAGSRSACIQLAEIYERGQHGVQADAQAAATWLEKAGRSPGPGARPSIA